MNGNGRHHNGSGGAPGDRRLRLVPAAGARRGDAGTPVSAGGDDVVDRFLASDFTVGMPVPLSHARLLTASLVHVGRDDDPGDPLHWNAPSLTSRLARWRIGEVATTARDALRALEVLARFVAFAHDERGVPSYATDETLEVLADVAPSVRCVGWGDGRYRSQPRASWEPYAVTLRRELYEEIGGSAAVAALDDRPLPDEPFKWDGLEHADQRLVADVLRRSDEACDAWLDVEMRTLCRRGLAALVRHDRALFQRSQRTDVIAAGLVWATLRVNELRKWLDRPFNLPQQIAMAAYMGVGTGSMSGRRAPSRSAGTAPGRCAARRTVTPPGVALTSLTSLTSPSSTPRSPHARRTESSAMRPP